MARNLLSRHLARALQDWRSGGERSRQGRAAGDPAMGPTLLPRRRLLGRAVALGISALGLAAAPACGSRNEAGREPRIAIIGGGIAGLSCAWRLRQAGIAADIYEAAPRLGGRILCDHASFAGQHIELGGEFIDSDHSHMLGLAAALGIPLLDFRTDDQRLAEFSAFIDGAPLTRAGMVRAFAPFAEAIDRETRLLPKGEIDATWKRNRRAQELDRMPLAQWLDGVGDRGPMRRVLEIAYTAEFGLDPQDNNPLNLLLLISADADKLSLFGDSDERFHAAGGNDRFVSGLAGRLDAARIHPGCALESVRTTADGRYALSFARDGATIEVTADHAVFALPFTMLRRVRIDAPLPAAKRQAIDGLGYGANTKLLCGFSARPWRTSGASGIVYADLPFQSCWEASRLQAGAGGVITNYTGGAAARAISGGPLAQRQDDFHGQFDRVFPGAKALATGKAVRIAWHQQPFAAGSYSAYRVGQYATIAGEEAAPVGGLHFCGEHACPEFQGFMAGGARSGARAAGEIASALGLADRLPALPRG
jgi:monoamine oxidase